MFIANLLIRFFFGQKGWQLLLYKSDTCTCFFLPKCPLKTVRSRFGADEQQMYPWLRLGQFVVCPY